MEPIRLFDAHCHLQDSRISADMDAVMQRARQAGVEAMMCCGSAEDDWDRVQEWSKHDGVFISFGLHPWYVDKRSAGWLENLAHYLQTSPIAGVGEIGLDHALDNVDLEAQEEVFIGQLRLARDFQRPVSIHCRKAFGRLLEILKFEGGVAHGGIIHSYSGPKDLVPLFEAFNLSISFSGSITRTNNKRGHEAVMAVSADRLLIETDSPDLPPVQAAPGKPNEPANIVFVLEKIAQLTGETSDAIALRTWENACGVFVK